MRIRLIKFILLSATIFISLACKCGWNGNFLRVGPYEDLVVKCRVIGFSKIHSDMDEKMTIEIQHVFKGKEKRRKIEVIGDDGMSCRPYISTFKKGEIYYLAINKTNEFFEISVCGEYWLHVVDRKIKMKKNEEEPEPNEMTELEFEKLLIKEIKK